MMRGVLLICVFGCRYPCPGVPVRVAGEMHIGISQGEGPISSRAATRSLSEGLLFFGTGRDGAPDASEVLAKDGVPFTGWTFVLMEIPSGLGLDAAELALG